MGKFVQGKNTVRFKIKLKDKALAYAIEEEGKTQSSFKTNLEINPWHTPLR
jgi:hypothetical protein